MRIKSKHRKTDYKMKMRRDREKDQIRKMKQFQFNKILPCMTSQQKVRCRELRNDD